ncbi:MAG: MotA/TolQ/ExbB proton channel family protein, partial [Pseudomonadota bacterium]
MDSVAAALLLLLEAPLRELAPAWTPPLSAQVEGLAPPEGAVDFSIQSMVLRADIVVQSVMALLVVASFWSWAIIFEKALGYRRTASRIRRFEDEFWSGKPLDDLFDRIGAKPGSPIERVFSAGMAEWRRSFGNAGGLIVGTQARIDRAMNVALAREADRISARLSFLATVGSISPFVGLFATVW